MYPVDLVTQDLDRAHSELTHSWELKFLSRCRTQCTQSTGYTEDPLIFQMYDLMPAMNPVDRMTMMSTRDTADCVF